MTAIAASQPRSLLLAVVIGALAGALLHTAMIMPWLSLFVREPGEVEWLNNTHWLQRYVTVLKASLIITAIYSPLLLGVAAFASHAQRRSLGMWLILGTLAVCPLMLLALFLANDGFDCFTNCEPLPLRNLVAVSGVLVPGAVGTWFAWLFRYGGRRALA